MLKIILSTIAILLMPISQNNLVVSTSKNTILKKEEYSIVKSKIINRKLVLKTKYLAATTLSDKNKILEESRNLMTKIILDEIIPFWYDTKWSFEGHTEVPKSGKIACGYFVSTTLNHAGLKINRFKLAQKSPLDEAKTLQISGNIEEIENTSVSTFKSNFLKNKKDGLYFIGLDFHVGYLLKHSNELYFIHSNYINSQGVVKEKIIESEAFKSKKYIIAPITQNDKLVQKWITGEVLVTE